jgi:hypothetical protein
MKSLILSISIVPCWAASATSAQAQYSAVTSPFNSTSSSYFEQFGVGFGVRTRNFFFEQNSLPLAVPPFGGFTPSAGVNVGIPLAGDGVSGFINIAASQGSRTSMVSQAPSITLANGVPGGFFDTSQTPFVVGVIPVVNDAPITPLNERLARIKAGEQSPALPANATGSHSGANRRNSTGDAWRDRVTASQHEDAGPALSVGEIRRRKALQPAKPK